MAKKQRFGINSATVLVASMSGAVSDAVPAQLRDTLVHLGMNDRLSPEQMKAISQNIGHDNVLTTLTSYGEVSYQRQGEIIRGLATPQKAKLTGADEIAEAVFKKFRDSGVTM